MSAKDIDMGERWSNDVAAELEAAAFGIICITKGNASEPWVNFEAGALSRALDRARVCPLLLDLRPAELDRRSPLLQFQAATLDSEQMLQLVHSINRASEAPRSLEFLEKGFRKWWPELQANFDKALRESRLHTQSPVVEPTKSRIEIMLEELLELTRDQVRSAATRMEPARRDVPQQSSLESHLPPTHSVKLREELSRFQRLQHVTSSEGARQRLRALVEIQRHVNQLRRLASRSPDVETLLAEATALLDANRLSPVETLRSTSVPLSSRPDLRSLLERTLSRAGARNITIESVGPTGESRFDWNEGPSEADALVMANRVLGR
jgi:hypothetical protein